MLQVEMENVAAIINFLIYWAPCPMPTSASWNPSFTPFQLLQILDRWSNAIMLPSSYLTINPPHR